MFNPYSELQVLYFTLCISYQLPFSVVLLRRLQLSLYLLDMLFMNVVRLSLKHGSKGIRVDGAVELPIRVGMTQSNLDKGHDLLMEV
jgi:hypothetical protein